MGDSISRSVPVAPTPEIEDDALKNEAKGKSTEAAVGPSPNSPTRGFRTPRKLAARYEQEAEEPLMIITEFREPDPKDKTKL